MVLHILAIIINNIKVDLCAIILKEKSIYIIVSLSAEALE